MIRAGALYYAIFVSMIFILITGFLITYAYLSENFIDKKIIKDQLKDDIESVFNIALNKPGQIQYNKPLEYNFTNTVSTLSLKKRHWGVYDILTTQAGYKDIRIKETILTGENIFLNENFALYLTDRQKYLSISGKTRLEGDCFLPELGIKKAYIEGKGYDKDKTVWGTKKSSKKNIRPFNNDILKHISSFFEKELSGKDSVLFFKDIQHRRSISNSFYNKTLIISVNEPSRIFGMHISGNIIILANAPITLTSTAMLEQVLVFAPSIKVEEGFKGSFQGFATRDIVLEKQSELNYPSFLGVIRMPPESSANITLNRNANVEGGVFLVDKNGSEANRSKIYINKGAKVTGQVYCQGSIQHKGNIEGTLYCNKFFLKTLATLYENHLLDAKISFQALSTDFCGADIVKGIKNGQILMKLN